MRLSHLSYERLLELRVTVASAIENEIQRRRSGPMTGWQCEVCKQVFPADDAQKCIQHVKKAHKYSLEDASIATHPLYQ